MAAPPDLASLAKRYLDLWQEQLIAMAADPDIADAFAPLVAALVRLGWLARMGDEPGGADAAGGAASAGATSGVRRDRMDDLARRLAAVERRLAALEAGTRGSGKRPPARRRRHRS